MRGMNLYYLKNRVTPETNRDRFCICTRRHDDLTLMSSEWQHGQRWKAALRNRRKTDEQTYDI